MQLIGLVLTVFFILSMMLATMQKISMQQTSITHRILDHLAIESNLLEEASNQFFEQSLKKNPKNPSKKDLKVKKTFYNRRVEKGYLLNARLVIKELFTTQNKDLEAVTLALLKELYADEKTIDPESLLEEILTKGKDILKQKPKIESFCLYHLSNPSKQLLQVMEGTRGFSYQHKNGYPPLSDYLEIYPKSDRKPVCAPFASLALLNALFGGKGAEEILKEESARFFSDEKDPYLHRQGLIELFQKKSIQIPLEILNLIADKKMRQSKPDEIEMIVMDPKLQLEARGTLRTFPLKRDEKSKVPRSQTRSTVEA
jgi:hypothetical protein